MDKGVYWTRYHISMGGASTGAMKRKIALGAWAYFHRRQIYRAMRY